MCVCVCVCVCIDTSIIACGVDAVNLSAKSATEKNPIFQILVRLHPEYRYKYVFITCNKYVFRTCNI